MNSEPEPVPVPVPVPVPCRYKKRGCAAVLEAGSPFKACEACRVYERASEKKRREAAVERNAKVDADATMRACTTCAKEWPLEHFRGAKFDGALVKSCTACRQRNKIGNDRRDKEHHRAQARVSAAKPERKAVKRVWREANHDKVALATMNFRQRRIEREGVEGYLQKNAETAKAWRQAHPDKVQESNLKKNSNIPYSYQNYIRDANQKNRDFDLSFDAFDAIVRQHCAYCGTANEDKGFVGIDRRDQNVGYIGSNCVPCCEMCNFMKKTASEQVFLQRVEHIVVNAAPHQTEKPFASPDLILGPENNGRYQLHPEAFDDIRGNSYKAYIDRANAKGLDMEIPPEAFETLRESPCYICAKENSNFHRNGVDRVDNAKGYTFENAQACCANCNYMKRAYDLDVFYEKCWSVFRHRVVAQRTAATAATAATAETATTATTAETAETTTTATTAAETAETAATAEIAATAATATSTFSKPKKSKDELRRINSEKKQKARTLLREKYGDEEYKKLHAKQIANDRAARKLREEAAMVVVVGGGEM